MYVDPNLQQYCRAMSGRAGNRDGRRYFCVPLTEHTRATGGTRAAGWPPLGYSVAMVQTSSFPLTISSSSNELTSSRADTQKYVNCF